MLDLALPKNHDDALSRPDAAYWVIAMEKELKAFDAMGVMQHDLTNQEINDLGLGGKSAVPLMWVYDLKISPSGEYEKHKARIVLCGHKGFMVKGVHYTDTFAAAPDVTVSRTLQALACGLGWERRTYDVSTAYLQADATSDEDRIPLIYPKGIG